MSKFQVIILGVFGFFIVISVIVFSKYKGSGQDAATVIIWGSIPTLEFQSILGNTSLVDNKFLTIVYEEKEAGALDSLFVEALAAGGGPDLIILPHDKIEKQKNKITLIPYTAYSERNFKDSFISGAEIYLDPQGIIALPLFIDPLVMYWNRSMFVDVNLTQPPKFWDEFYALSQAISKSDDSLNILKSATALGEFANVSHAKEIISNLMMQAGTPVVSYVGGKPVSVLANTFEKTIIPAEAALNFYTQFSNPAKPFYSWNRSLPSSSDYFLSSKLGVYLGFASELFDIRAKNPNLDFDVALVPSSRDVGVNVSYAKFWGLAISRSSKSPNAALQVATLLSNPEGGVAINKVMGLPPLRRDLLGVQQTSGYQDTFYKSAIRSKAWLDPDPEKTSVIFRNMVESITSGRERTSSAVNKASREMGDLFNK